MPAGRQQDPGRRWIPPATPALGLAAPRNRPTAPTHLSRRREHVPQAELARISWRQGPRSPKSQAKGAPVPFKERPVGVACVRPAFLPAPPRPAPPAGFPEPLAGLGRVAGWLPSARLRASHQETKGRRPASSCSFPPARHLPTSRDRSLPKGPGSSKSHWDLERDFLPLQGGPAAGRSRREVALAALRRTSPPRAPIPLFAETDGAGGSSSKKSAKRGFPPPPRLVLVSRFNVINFPS